MATITSFMDGNDNTTTNGLYTLEQMDNVTQTTTSVVNGNGSYLPEEDVTGTGTEEGQVVVDAFQWTIWYIVQAIVIFMLAGLAEIGGGWLVWKSIRANKPYWWAILGSIILILYGFLPTLQPTDTFGRIYAVYGGFFIVLSFLAGWLLDGDQPDLGDLIGGGISLVGVLLILFWPR